MPPHHIIICLSYVTPTFPKYVSLGNTLNLFPPYSSRPHIVTPVKDLSLRSLPGHTPPYHPSSDLQEFWVPRFPPTMDTPIWLELCSTCSRRAPAHMSKPFEGLFSNSALAQCTAQHSNRSWEPLAAEGAASPTTLPCPAQPIYHFHPHLQNHSLHVPLGQSQMPLP